MKASMNTSREEKILDLPALLERLDGDMELVHELLALYLEDCPRLISGIKAAITVKDSRSLDGYAHSMKGASANLGALRLQSLSYELEQMGKNSQLDQAPAVFQALEGQFQIFEDYVREGFLS